MPSVHANHWSIWTLFMYRKFIGSSRRKYDPVRLHNPHLIESLRVFIHLAYFDLRICSRNHHRSCRWITEDEFLTERCQYCCPWTRRWSVNARWFVLDRREIRSPVCRTNLSNRLRPRWSSCGQCSCSCQSQQQIQNESSSNRSSWSWPLRKFAQRRTKDLVRTLDGFDQ